MAFTSNSGPFVSTGPLGTLQNSEPEAGPCVDYQGSAVLDTRNPLVIGQAPNVGKVPAILNNAYFTLVDFVPQTKSTTNIVNAATAANGTPLTLPSTLAAGIGVNVPVVPQTSQLTVANQKLAVCLDPGFTTGTTVAGTNTVTIPAGGYKFFQSYFLPATVPNTSNQQASPNGVAGYYMSNPQSICILGAGSAANQPLFCKVVAVNSQTNVMTIDRNAGTSVTNGPVMSADPTLTTVQPTVIAGATGLWNPVEMLSRALVITGSAAGQSGATYTIRGMDVYGWPQTEVITSTGAAAVNGKKSWKYITSITPANGTGTVGAGTTSVGTLDIIGLNVRSDVWEYMNVFVNGSFVVANTGWTAADNTYPATASSGDTRGTYTLQTASNGTLRIAFFMSIPQFNLVNSNNLSQVSMFGQPNFWDGVF